MPAIFTDKIVECKSKELPKEKVKLPLTTNYTLSPKLIRLTKSRIRVTFKGNCLKQDK